MPRWTSFLDKMVQRKKAYQAAFGPSGFMGSDCMFDLAEFCHAHKPTWHEDARHHARLEGRREVWLRIAYHLNLTPEQLEAVYEPIARRKLGEGNE